MGTHMGMTGTIGGRVLTRETELAKGDMMAATTAAQLHPGVFEAINNRDWNGLRDLYHPDLVYVTGDGDRQAGPDAPVGAAKMFVDAFPDLTVDVQRHHTTDDGSVSVIEYTFSGTHEGDLEGIPATGRRIEVVACSVSQASDGRIVEERDYYDTLAVMAQLGVSVDPSAAG